MKKIFTVLVALATIGGLQATNYFLGGDAPGWSPDNAKYQFVEENGVLTVHVDDLFGGLKVFPGAWHPQFGADTSKTGTTGIPDSIHIGETYTMVKCDDSNGEKDSPANLMVGGLDLSTEEKALPEDQRPIYHYANAVLTLDVTDPDAPKITLVSGTKYDFAKTPPVYKIVGGFSENWNFEAGCVFEEKNGVLTCEVPDVSGSFKVVYGRTWETEYGAAPGTAIDGQTPFTLVKKEDGVEIANIAFINPFKSYKNAVFTLTEDNDGNKVLTLISGDNYTIENDWFLPGSKLGWECKDAQKFDKIDATTYEFDAPEFGGTFKVVYGEWAIEFGADTTETGEIIKWENKKPYTMGRGIDDMQPADEAMTYIDMTIVINVDYENATVVVTLDGTPKQTPVENVFGEQNAPRVHKTLENGQVVIIRGGERYDLNGKRLR